MMQSGRLTDCKKEIHWPLVPFIFLKGKQFRIQFHTLPTRDLTSTTKKPIIRDFLILALLRCDELEIRVGDATAIDLLRFVALKLRVADSSRSILNSGPFYFKVRPRKLFSFC